MTRLVIGWLAAVALMQAGQTAPAVSVEQLQQRLQAHPEWQEGWWNLGSILYDADRYAEAVNAFTHLMKLRPDAAPALALLGLSEYEIRDYPSALAHIQTSLQLGVDDQPQMAAVLRFHEALLLTRDGQFDRALHKYAQFVPKTITDRQLQLGLGLLALRRPATPAEVAESDEPMVSEAGSAMAELLTGPGEAARAEFQHLAAKYGDAAGVQFALGFAFYAFDADVSIAAWKRELEHHPEASSAQGLLAWTYFLRNEPTRARQHAEAALKQDPRLAVANIVIGRAELESGKREQGLARLEKVAAGEEDNLEAHLALASGYSALGRKADAQRERQIAVQLRTKPVAQP